MKNFHYWYFSYLHIYMEINSETVLLLCFFRLTTVAFCSLSYSLRNRDRQKHAHPVFKTSPFLKGRRGRGIRWLKNKQLQDLIESGRKLSCYSYRVGSNAASVLIGWWKRRKGHLIQILLRGEKKIIVLITLLYAPHCRYFKLSDMHASWCLFLKIRCW